MSEINIKPSHWSQKNNKDVLNAITSVFALITCSDGELSGDEATSFLYEVNKSGLSTEKDNNELLNELYNIRDLLKQDFKSGKQFAINQLKIIKYDKEVVKIALQFAQIAIIANKSIKMSEEYIMKEICDILEVNAEEYCLAETA
ncbi:MAG: hypothetical protein O2970_10360 [Proteobacteria bacterium]|nr:hypothetical protein [Pseudomonadota bacterium]MDA0967344.1 hypothetical protein [Pseudomonadota bacterium]